MEILPPSPPLQRNAAMVGLHPINAPFKLAHDVLHAQMVACDYIFNTNRRTHIYRVLKRMSDMLDLASMWISSGEILENNEASEFIMKLVLSKYYTIMKMSKVKRNALLSNFELARYFKHKILTELKRID